MGSKTFDGVWFISYSHDHSPPHVHGQYAEVIVIVDLFVDGTTGESDRTGSVQPENAKRSDIKRILRIAASHGQELMKL